MSSPAPARWLNEPSKWSLDQGGLVLSTDLNTDFWQTTYYGFVHDNGHFRYVDVEGDFTASLVFDGRYETLYDQAGIMLRIDPSNWIKLGIEYSDGECNFSLVCTVEGRSDWSVVPSGSLAGPQAVRVTRVGDAAVAHFRRPDGRWRTMRLCPFPPSRAVQVGPMACSPKRSGFEVAFGELRIGPPMADPLHGDD